MAQKHPSNRRPRGEPDTGEDLFIARTLQATEWARENATILIAMGIALGLVIWGALYYVDFREQRSSEATMRIQQIRQTAQMGDAEAAKRELGVFIQRYERDVSALEGRLLLGQLQLETGEVPGAVQTLEPAFAGTPKRPLEIQGAFLLAAAYEEVGRWEDAEEIYLEIADRAEMTFQRRQALTGAARIRARQGEYAGAAELYGRILEGMPEDDPERSLYLLRLGEMEAAAS